MLKKYLNAVEERLAEIIPAENDPPLYDAMRYSLLAGGKRLRPCMLLAAVEMLGGRWEDAMEMGARRLIRGAMALACVALVLIAACFVPGTAWAQTVQFQNRATAEMDESGVITGTCSTTAVFLPNTTALPGRI